MSPVERREIVPTTLDGKNIRLEALKAHHFDGLKALVDDQGELIFKNSPMGLSFEDYFEKAMAARAPDSHVPFVLRQKSDDAYVGMSRLFDVSPVNRTLEIGYTWYHPDFWGTPVNPDSKLTLLTHAFEHAACNRVSFLTDVRNKHSQSAIAKLGGVREGIIRSHRVLPCGRIRDSVMFSIIRDEWPKVKAGLEARLS